MDSLTRVTIVQIIWTWITTLSTLMITISNSTTRILTFHSLSKWMEQTCCKEITCAHQQVVNRLIEMFQTTVDSQTKVLWLKANLSNIISKTNKDGQEQVAFLQLTTSNPTEGMIKADTQFLTTLNLTKCLNKIMATIISNLKDLS
jgi:hypothetical protein